MYSPVTLCTQCTQPYCFLSHSDLLAIAMSWGPVPALTSNLAYSGYFFLGCSVLVEVVREANHWETGYCSHQ